MHKDNYNIESYVMTNVGRVRNNNEDNFLFFNHILEDGLDNQEIRVKSTTDELCLFGVFDGMGGHAHGEVASLISAAVARGFIFDLDMIEEGLNHICIQANYLVCEKMKEYKERIGSTASMLALYEKKAYLCNIGDTPIYLYRHHNLSKLYEEHTERKMYERLYGTTNPKKKYRLTQNIGIFEEEMMIKPYTSCIDLEDGDCLIICSDGLTDMVSEERIGEILETNHREQCISLLQREALEAGGKDNITIILIYIDRKRLFNLFRK